MGKGKTEIRQKLDEKIRAQARTLKPGQLKKTIRLVTSDDILEIVVSMIEQYGSLEQKELIAKLAEMELRHGQSAKKIESLQGEAETLRRDLQAARTAADADVPGKADEQIASLRQERDAERERADILQKERDEARSDAEDARSKLAKAEERHRASLDRAVRQLDEARAALQSLEALERELRAKVDSLTRELERQKQDYERLIAELRERMRSLEVALDRFVLVPEFDFGLAVADCSGNAEVRERLEFNRGRFRELMEKMESGDGTVDVISKLREVLAESRALAGRFGG